MIDAHKQAFKEEAVEILSELEISLLEVENQPDNMELIARIFRALHTLKGSSGMFGFDDISMFTHDIESVYDLIRNSKLSISKEIIDLTLAARDQISLMLNESKDGNGDSVKEIIAAFRSIMNEYESGQTGSKNLTKQKSKKEPLKNTSPSAVYHIYFKPERTIFQSGTNPVLLLNELSGLGDIIIAGNLNDVPSLEFLDPELCYVYWDIMLKTNKGIDSIKDVFIFVEDSCELKIKTIDEKGILNNEDNFSALKEYIEQYDCEGNIDFNDILKQIEQQSTVTKTVEKQKDKKRVKESAENHHESDAGSSIRVSAEKLDELVNLVGELVTIQARLSQIASKNDDSEITSVSEEVERITWSLRDSALNIRMLPIGTTFSKFKRLVRDLSKELGKEVELTTEGAETELDKTVIERLNDPLIHIIRNCIDHGIENPSERENNNKPGTGKVHLSASQSGGNVLLKISDDGAGMDKEAIRQKAISLGMIAENAELTDSEIYSMIFAPGFSTAKKVTNVSGRGVGMDVVRKAIDNLRGTVEVYSERGKGTTIILKLPLTLAIIDGLLVQIENDFYVLPLSAVEECVELSAQDIINAHGRNVVNIRGELVPYINLRERFDIDGDKPAIEQVVIAGIKGMRVGFVVDKVIGQHQTVLKTLGKVYKNVEGVSGATILGDGTVALILDIIKISEVEELEEKKNYQ